jgi:alpha-beta hydrolase superfamily lysophospholipase
MRRIGLAGTACVAIVLVLLGPVARPEPAAAVAWPFVAVSAPPNIVIPPLPSPLTPKAPAEIHVVRHARGAALILHGGAWRLTGANAIRAERPDARAWQRRGWTTDNADYRAGSASLADVVGDYERLRQLVGRHAAVCVVGASSGGQLALLLAERFPAIRCVVAEAAPVEITALTGPVRQAADEYLLPGGSASFWSPAEHADDIHCPVLLSAAADDAVIDPAQSVGLARILGRRAILALLPADAAGPEWVHAGVTPRSLAAYRQIESRLASAAAAGALGSRRRR